MVVCPYKERCKTRIGANAQEAEIMDDRFCGPTGDRLGRPYCPAYRDLMNPHDVFAEEIWLVRLPKVITSV